MTLVNYSKTLLCVEDVCTAGSETPVCLFKNTSFYRTFLVAGGEKKETPAKTYFSEFCKIFKNIF